MKQTKKIWNLHVSSYLTALQINFVSSCNCNSLHPFDVFIISNWPLLCLCTEPTFEAKVDTEPIKWDVVYVFRVKNSAVKPHMYYTITAGECRKRAKERFFFHSITVHRMPFSYTPWSYLVEVNENVIFCVAFLNSWLPSSKWLMCGCSTWNQYFFRCNRKPLELLYFTLHVFTFNIFLDFFSPSFCSSIQLCAIKFA